MLSGFDGLRFSHWLPEIRDDGVVVLSLDRQDSSVNAMSQDVLLELGDLLERIAMDPPKGVVIQSLKKAGFIAGADLKEFQEFDRRGTVNDAIRRGQATYQKLAELPCPTVAAIHGHCLGGGTELALACRYRVASNDSSTRIGLPETQLGIFPGWGGSARLPQLVGAPAAMDMMLTGRTLSASAARGIGLVDKVVAPAVVLDTAVALALSGTTRPFKQRATAWATNTWLARTLLAPQMVKQVARKAKKDQYPAPYALISTWQRSGGKPVQARLDAERRAVVKLASTPTARNLIRIFFLTERLKGLGGGDSGIRHVHVVGAGVMGGDIAAWAAYKGFEGHPAGPRAALHRPGHGARAGAVRQEGTRREQASRGGRAPACRPGRQRRGRGRPGDRGDHREPGSQACAVPDAGTEDEAGRAADHQYFVDSAGGTARPYPAPGTVRRPALLQPGRADAVGGDHPSRRHGA